MVMARNITSTAKGINDTSVEGRFILFFSIYHNVIGCKDTQNREIVVKILKKIAYRVTQYWSKFVYLHYK